MAVIEGFNKFTLLREENKEKIYNFRKYLELNNIKNIDRREDFLLRCFMDINNQYDVLFKKNSNNNDYLRILYKIHRFLMDAFISVAANLKCLDYVDFCFSYDNKSVLSNFKLSEKKVEDKIIENSKKEKVILLNNYNSFFETINFDNKFNSFYGHHNLIDMITNNIDSYVFREIFNYCNKKTNFKVYNRDTSFNPVLERTSYSKLDRLIFECDMTIISESKFKGSNFILTSPDVYSILSLSDNFKPINSNLGGFAVNVGEYKDKRVCVLNDINNKILVLGYPNSNLMFQLFHIIGLPDIEELNSIPVFMESTVKILDNNLLQVIKVEDSRKELNYES